jgi:hypothetical protein
MHDGLILVPLCTLRIHRRDYMARGTQKRRDIKVVDGRKAKVEPVGSLPLVFHGGFTLILNQVLYVPSLQRNIISVFLLEDDGYECLFENNKCTIMYNDKVIGLAPRQGMGYMLSLNDFPMMNVCDVPNRHKKSDNDNETFSKLCHCCLGYISREE